MHVQLSEQLPSDQSLSEALRKVTLHDIRPQFHHSTPERPDVTTSTSPLNPPIQLKWYVLISRKPVCAANHLFIGWRRQNCVYLNIPRPPTRTELTTCAPTDTPNTSGPPPEAGTANRITGASIPPSCFAHSPDSRRWHGRQAPTAKCAQECPTRTDGSPADVCGVLLKSWRRS